MYSRYYTRTAILLSFILFISSACGDPRLSSMSQVVGSASEDECPYGGIIFVTGKDKNGNGTLELSEIMDKHIVCEGSDAKSIGAVNEMGRVWEGSAVVMSPLDIARLQPYSIVTGDVIIESVSSLSLPKLKIVRGDLDIKDTSLLDLQGLTRDRIFIHVALPAIPQLGPEASANPSTGFANLFVQSF